MTAGMIVMKVVVMLFGGFLCVASGYYYAEKNEGFSAYYFIGTALILIAAFAR